MEIEENKSKPLYSDDEEDMLKKKKIKEME